jgi:hypothetical protein
MSETSNVEVPTSPTETPISERLQENATALQNWMNRFDEHVRNVSNPLFGRGYGIEEQVSDLFQVTARLGQSLHAAITDLAEAFRRSPYRWHSG